jgi:hypothetical protein
MIITFSNNDTKVIIVIIILLIKIFNQAFNFA